MTKENAAQYLPLVQALAEKKMIQQLERERDEARKEARNYRDHLYGCHEHRLWQGDSCIGCVELERDQLRKRVEELELQLAVIGEIAVMDWDDATLGKVEAVVPYKDQQKYKDKLRLLFQTIPDENKQLRKVADELAEAGRCKCCEHSEIACDDCIAAFKNYNQLPHVILKNTTPQ